MKLSAAFSILIDLRYAIQIAFLPTLHEVWASPSLLFQPTALSRLFMAKMWIIFGDGVDEGGATVKKHLITPNAYGVVLDIGAGHGHAAKYFDRNRVTKYIALEPNTTMHPRLRKTASKFGFTESDGTLLVLSCGAEDITSITSSIRENSVDTLVSVLTLCSVPSPENTMHMIVSRALKPGGQFLFYEHVLSPRPDVAWWQKFWAPIWALVFDGCRMDCPTNIWLEQMTHEDGESVWSEQSVWGKEGELEENLFYHRVGKMIK